MLLWTNGEISNSNIKVERGQAGKLKIKYEITLIVGYSYLGLEAFSFMRLLAFNFTYPSKSGRIKTR